jgi:hypothetical protein
MYLDIVYALIVRNAAGVIVQGEPSGSGQRVFRMILDPEREYTFHEIKLAMQSALRDLYGLPELDTINRIFKFNNNYGEGLNLQGMIDDTASFRSTHLNGQQWLMARAVEVSAEADAPAPDAAAPAPAPDAAGARVRASQHSHASYILRCGVACVAVCLLYLMFQYTQSKARHEL